jgi:hypothetical protein
MLAANLLQRQCLCWFGVVNDITIAKGWAWPVSTAGGTSRLYYLRQ